MRGTERESEGLRRKEVEKGQEEEREGARGERRRSRNVTIMLIFLIWSIMHTY